MGREITFKDLLLLLVRKIRPIIITALIFALLLGVFGIYRSAGINTEPVDKDRLSQELAYTERNLESVKGYYDTLTERKQNSTYFQIDYSNVAICESAFMLSPEDKTLTFDENEKLITNLSTAFADIIYSQSVLEAVNSDNQTNIYPQDYKLIIECSKQPNSNVINVKVYDISLERAESISVTAINKANSLLSAYLSECRVIPLYTNSYFGTVESIKNNHENFNKTINGVSEQINNLQNAVNSLKAQLDSNGSMLNAVTAKQFVKYGAVGFLLGLIISYCVCLIIYINSDRLQNTYELRKKYDLRILGFVADKKSGRAGKKVKCALGNERPNDSWENLGVTAATVRALAGDKKLALSGTAGANELKEISDKLSKAEGIETEVIENIASDPQSIKKLADKDAVVLVEKCGETRYSGLNAEILQIETLGKEILGIIII